ncbi:MAG: hypothetical protein JNL60_17650, partial [Bacteroidia bacterium]|nr:hypothetical protein [Bacteroidia bacterium]
VKNDKAEFGRYICQSPAQAIESEFLLLKYAFEVMNLKAVYCRTKRINERVWKQHYNFGFLDVGEELMEDFMLNVQEITKEQFLNFDYSKILKLITRIASR